MVENIVEEIKKFVQEECRKPSSKYGLEPFENHFIPMVKYAELLAEKFPVDKEVISLAAWLHDVGSIIFGRENHHLTGAQIAEKKLRELNYSEDKISLVKKCILNHRGSKQNSLSTPEEKIIAEADCLSNFNNLAGIFKAALVYENLSQKEAILSVRRKLEQKWNQLSFEESKKIIKPKYEAAMLLLGD